ncbi:MAG: hypothetical protein K0U78_11525 [Actinomycetia bacterium]|nr:hypothetical protein [Actinomycetes bacterium]
MGAFLVDVLPGFGVMATMVLPALTAPSEGWLRWAFIGVGATTLFAIAMVLNRVVLLATEIIRPTPNRKSTTESGSRWLATAVKERQEWKISNLVQVI